jgi:DNA-binding CsgD family transcriptional regulator
LEIDFPFGVALQLVEPTLASAAPRELSTLLAGAASPAEALLKGSTMGPVPVQAAEDRLFSLVHGLFWLVSNLAQREPLLLCVDDAHWVDRPSMRLLAYLADRIDGLPALLVLTARRGEPGSAEDLLAALRAAPTAETLRPAPLSEAAVEELVRFRRPDPDAAFCSACAKVTGGNPLLLDELMFEVERSGIPARAGEAERLGRLVPDRVGDAVATRLADLPLAAQALAKVAAVLGEDAELRHVTALAELDDAASASAVDALTAAGVLAGNGEQPQRAEALPARSRPAGVSGRLRFAHPLVAAAVRDRVPAGESGLLHWHAARVLHDSGAHPEQVAAHLDAAPAAGEPWALSALRAAAERAMSDGAPASAARWLRRALDEAPASDRAAVLAELGRAELALGDSGGAARIAEAAEIETDPGREAQLLLELGRAQAESGEFGRGTETLERAREIAPDERLAIEIEAAWVTFARHIPALQERALARTREMLARPRPVTHGERVLLAAASNQAVFAGEPHERVLDLAHRALDDGALLADETAAGFSWTIALGALGWADDFATVERVSREALADARTRGSIAGFATASHAHAYAAFHTGRVVEAAADCRQAIDAHPDPAWFLRPFACVQLAWAEIERGDWDAAEEAIERCDPDERWADAPVYMLVLDARGRVALARGRPDDALELVLEAGRLASATQMPNPAVVPWRASAVEAYVRTGDRESAASIATEELRLARQFGAPRAIGAAHRSAGLAERGERTVELLAEAVSTLAGSAARLEHARALVDLGAAQRRAGTPAVARDTLRDGLALARECGALALARRAEEELDAAGARPRSDALRGPAALTPSELRVARMAADGMTNREIAQALFVTVKAVQFHLRNAYRKLDVPGRQELPGALEPTTV